MTQSVIIGFALLVSLLLFVAAWVWDKEGRTSSYLFAGAGMIMLITGLLVLVDPITFTGGVTTTVNETIFSNVTTLISSVAVNDQVSVSNNMNLLLGISLLLAGMFGVITGLRGRDDEEDIDPWTVESLEEGMDIFERP